MFGKQRAFLMRYLRPYTPQLFLLFMVLMGVMAFDLVQPQILKTFIQSAIAGKPLFLLINIALLFFGAAVGEQIVSVVEVFVAGRLGWVVTNTLRKDLTLHCLRLDPSFFSTYTPGELIERVDGDISSLNDLFSRFVVYVVGNIILLVGIVVAIFFVSAIIGITLALFSFLTLIILNTLRTANEPNWLKSRQASAELFGFLEEKLTGIDNIRPLGAIKYNMVKLYRLARHYTETTRKAGVVGIIINNVINILFTLGTAIALSLGMYLFFHANTDIGVIYIIFSYTDMLRSPLQQLSRQMQSLQQITACLVRIQELFDIKSTIVDGEQSLPDEAPSIDFQRVAFAYTKEKPVLENVSFYLEPGKILGIVGRTGSGKTTLARLLLRLYDPLQGTIKLGDQDLRTAKLDEVRQRVAMMTQDVQLFHATVRENLTLFDKRITDQQIMEALEQLKLLDWYQMLPDKLDTMLVSGGESLSAGEAQLLALARIYLRKPRLIILDEATSHLDPMATQHVEKALQALFAGRTGIIIAHKLSTLQQVDSILVLENYHILEYGSREQLANDPKTVFSRLLATGAEELLI